MLLNLSKLSIKLFYYLFISFWNNFRSSIIIFKTTSNYYPVNNLRCLISIFLISPNFIKIYILNHIMKKVILDTNFILTCIRNKIDFLEEIKFKGMQILIPKQVLKEIKRISNSRKKLRFRDRKSTRLNSSHIPLSRMPSSA